MSVYSIESMCRVQLQRQLSSRQWNLRPRPMRTRRPAGPLVHISAGLPTLALRLQLGRYRALVGFTFSHHAQRARTTTCDSPACQTCHPCTVLEYAGCASARQPCPSVLHVAVCWFRFRVLRRMKMTLTLGSCTPTTLHARAQLIRCCLFAARCRLGAASFANRPPPCPAPRLPA
jgi:hypothetical protein